MTLSPLGEFWQDYWSHHRRRYPEDVMKEGWADSNVRHPTADDTLSLSLYLMQDPPQVGIYMVATYLGDPERVEMVEPYLRRLRQVLNDATQSNMGGTHLPVDDVQDRANWDAMMEWLHHRRIIYGLVIREVVGKG